MKTALLASLLFVPTPILASTPMHRISEQGGHASEHICYRHIYTEQYIPGTSMDPGTVKTFRDKVEVSCNQQPVARSPETIETIPHEHVNPNVAPTVYNHQPVYDDSVLAHAGHVVQQPGYYRQPVYQQPHPNQVVVNNPPQQYPPQYNNPPQQVQQAQVQPRGRIDDNNCAAGTTLGALAGGAGAALLTSGGKDLLWSIPLGMVGGSMVGCQLNGG